MGCIIYKYVFVFQNWIKFMCNVRPNLKLDHVYMQLRTMAFFLYFLFFQPTVSQLSIWLLLRPFVLLS